MKKLFDKPLCFSINPKELIKYGGQLNLKGFFDALATMQENKRIQERKRDNQ